MNSLDVSIDVAEMIRNHEVIVTKHMIILALIQVCGMQQKKARRFVRDLDFSIDEEYVPIKDHGERYAKIREDAEKFRYYEGEH